MVKHTAMKTRIRIALWAAVASLALASCVKEIRPPVVEIDLDQSIYDSGEGTATLVGHVTDDGGELTDVGFCYTTGSSAPTIDDYHRSGGQRADFTVELTGLARGKYRVRAYATNRVGTSYSDPATLEITGYSVPTVSLGTCTANASNKSASLKGTVTANGGKPVTEAGFCYMKSSTGTGTPTISNNKVTSSNLTNLSATLNNLSDGTYRVRAYATNAVGTGYSSSVYTFNIGTAPTVILGNCTYNSSTNKALLYGTVTSDGGSSVTSAGFCYLKGSSMPYISNYCITSNNFTNLTATLSNLASGTYRVRAYATNQYGTSYSPTVYTITVTGGGSTTYTLSDVLGTYSCKAYDVGYKKWENWTGLTITSLNESLDGFSSPIIIDGFMSHAFFHIIGDWDYSNQCIRLKARWAQVSRTFVFSGNDTLYYAIFYPSYVNAEGTSFWWLFQYSNGDAAEALLKFNSSGQLEFSAAEQPDENGRYANSLNWRYYYADNGEYANGYSRVYNNVTMTKTSSSTATTAVGATTPSQATIHPNAGKQAAIKPNKLTIME